MSRRRPPTASIALASILTMVLPGTGCDQRGAVNKAEPGEIPASSQRSGDPDRGYDVLVNRAVVTCGLPFGAYQATTGHPPPQYPLPGRRGRNAELPYPLTAFTTPTGVELVTSNCLACHAAPLNGELVIGLGNEFLDFTGDPVLAVEAAGAFVEGEAEAAEWRRWADRLAAIAPWTTTDTIGANPASAITLALMAHRDPRTLAWSSTPLLTPPAAPLPTSVPPWWHLAKKHATFYNGEGRGDHVRTMILASTTCTDSVAEAREIDRWFTDVRAFLVGLRPPAWPHALDADLAARGGAVFRRECRECHGTYGDRPSYPNLLVALDEVGTDPALAEKGFYDSDRFVRWFNQSFYGELGEARPGLGYVAPPLDGIWATAPYLHNGSVPTLAALLDSRARPAIWRYAAVTPDYDPAAVGWRTETLTAGRDQFASLDEQKWVYDTGRRGFGNQGHTFGDELSDDDRRALLEYLKTL